MNLGRRTVFAATGWIVGLGLAGSSATAYGGPQFDERPAEASIRAGISLDEAVRRAEKQFNARVVKAETRMADGRRTYVLRLVTGDGRVITVRVDADSGAVD